MTLCSRMKAYITIFTLLVLTFSQPSSAQVMTLLHDSERVVSVTYPNGWQIRTPRAEGINIISAIPDDGSLLWQGLWVLKEAETIDQALERLHGLEGRLFSDVKLTKGPWQERIGELNIYNHEGTGLYQTKPVTFFISLFSLASQRIAALAYMGDPAAIELYKNDLTFIVQSLQPASK